MEGEVLKQSLDWEKSPPEIVEAPGVASDKDYELYKLVDLHGGGRLLK